MAKGFGKVLLTSSLLAGAALGTYMYFKQEGVIDETKSPAENAVKIRDKVTADAAEYFNKDRSYVDLNETVETVKEKAADLAADVKKTVEDAFEPGIAAEKIDSADSSKTIGGKVSEEFFNDET